MAFFFTPQLCSPTGKIIAACSFTAVCHDVHEGFWAGGDGFREIRQVGFFDNHGKQKNGWPGVPAIRYFFCGFLLFLEAFSTHAGKAEDTGSQKQEGTRFRNRGAAAAWILGPLVARSSRGARVKGLWRYIGRILVIWVFS